MERWCPRCEWVGAAAAACPRCGTSLLDVEAPPPAGGRSAARAEPARGGAGPATDPEPESGGPSPGALPTFRGRSRRWGGPALLIAGAVVVLAATLARGPTAGPSVSAPRPHLAASASTAPASPASLPDEIAFVAGGLSGGPGPQLYVARGSGARASTSRFGRKAAVFAWSPDGLRLAVGDIDGRVRLLPWGTAVAAPAPVSEVAFSPDGRYLATCGGRPTAISLFRVADPSASVRGGIPGCGPRWSPDGRYLAFRVPDRRVPGGFDARRIGVLSVDGGGWRMVRAGWPVAWAPGGHDVLVAAGPGGSVVAMNARGGDRRVVASAASVRALAGNPPAVGIRLLAWSPDGRWLAVGFAPGRLTDGGLAILAAGGGARVAFRDSGPQGYAMPVRASWSAGDRLLVEFDSNGGAYSEVLTPGGTGTFLSVVSASWSPDGRWVLGETPHGWVALQPGEGGAPLAISRGAQWSSAAWCCPPVPVEQVTG